MISHDLCIFFLCPLIRGTEGLPARAALPSHHQAPVRGRAGVHGDEAAADGSGRLRERPGGLGAHRQPAGQPAGGGEGEDDIVN